uniref:CG18266-PA n=1 Tax=Drosophila phaeopleura TaxID=195712 RepID=D1GZ23_9MUSC|nr:CG18266-PA [Drosophila phaeopleura]
MAFVARRSSDGKVVDRQPVSWRSSMPISDISDEDDTGSMLGYTNRTFRAPETVRFVGEGGDADGDQDSPKEAQTDLKVKSIKPKEMVSELDGGDASGSDVDSIMSFCQQLDDEETSDMMYNLTGAQDQEDLGDLQDLQDQQDQDDTDKESDIMTMMGKPEDLASITDTETMMNINDDSISMSSFGSFTPTVTESIDGDDNLDSISGRTFFTPNTREETKAIPQPDAISEADPGQLSSRTFDMSTRGSRRLHDGSSVSTCSWSDMYGEALQPSDNRSNVVPSLSLASVNSDTSTYYKNLEEVKERQGQAAYEDWKARKAAQKQQKILAEKRERKKREAEAVLRQKLAKERFQEWCRRKEEQQQKEQKASIRKSGNISASLSQASFGNSTTTSSISRKGMGSSPSTGPARQLAPEVTKKRLKEWERVKLEQQQQERERLRKQQEFKKKQEEDRKKRSQGAWNNWIKQVDKRAKPVPLNQGFDTLRGTISNIYINPVQWVSNIDPPKTGRSH